MESSNLMFPSANKMLSNLKTSQNHIENLTIMKDKVNQIKNIVVKVSIAKYHPQNNIWETLIQDHLTLKVEVARLIKEELKNLLVESHSFLDPKICQVINKIRQNRIKKLQPTHLHIKLKGYLTKNKKMATNMCLPIQHRAQELLKQKQKKLAKLKKEKQFSRILQQKECTFRPQIKQYKFSKNNEQTHRVSQFQKQRFEQCFIDEQFISPENYYNEQVKFMHQTLNSNIKMSPKQQTQLKTQPKRYKNEKFNFLLDLIQ